MELIMGKGQTQQSQKGGSFNEHWESVRFNPQGYDLYVSDPRWAGRFTMVTFERTAIYNGPPRIRTGYFDRLTGNFRFTGARRGGELMHLAGGLRVPRFFYVEIPP